MAANQIPTPEQVRASLGRITESARFVHAGSVTQLLKYIVERRLEGDSQSLKEYTLGLEVFRRGSDFDPKRDTIVRVQARTLRSRLESYYETDGQHDPVRITVPKGGYVPLFELKTSLERPTARTWVPRTRLRIAAIGLGVVGFFGILSVSRTPPRMNQCNTLAVLPFDEEQAGEGPFVAAALAQDLLTRLAEVPGLSLLSFESAARHKSARRPIQDLGAGCIAEGKVTHAGYELRVDLTLKDGKTGRRLWSNSYRRPAKDLPELEYELARAIGAHSGSAHLMQSTMRHALVDHDAAVLYLQAKHEFNKYSEEGFRRSIELYNKAIHRQPDYATAHAGLALAWLKYAFSMFAPPNEAMPKARAAAERAIELAPGLAEAHAVLAGVNLFYDWQPAAAYTELRRALNVAPGLALANEMHAIYSTATGRFEEAAQSVQRAREIDALSVPLMVMSEFISLASRRYADGSAYGLSAVAREPNVGLLRALTGMNLIYAGRKAEGLQQFSAGMRVDPSPAVALLTASGFARVGDTAQARRILADVKVQARRRYVCAYEVACVHAVLGENDEAFRWFDQAVTDRCDCMVWLNIEPWLDRIRADRRYEQLIRRVAFR